MGIELGPALGDAPAIIGEFGMPYSSMSVRAGVGETTEELFVALSGECACEKWP